MTFKEWLKNENVTGIYPPLYGGLAGYPSLYINTYTVYIDASIKAKTIPPTIPPTISPKKS